MKEVEQPDTQRVNGGLEQRQYENQVYVDPVPDPDLIVVGPVPEPHPQ